MEIKEKENGVILIRPGSFQLPHIFDCGQCFRWNQETNGSYTGVAYGQILNVEQVKQDIHFNGTTPEAFRQIWAPYFDLHTDYEQIKRHLASTGEMMARAVTFGTGLRILRQDLWETLISFIISANNNIPRIKGIIERLCRTYGAFLGGRGGREYYAFPEAAVLKEASVAELKACNTGYRAAYIQATAARIAEIGLDQAELGRKESAACLEELQAFSGVGPKVANCIAFFSLAKLDAFPVDVWIKRLMEHIFFSGPRTPAQIEAFAREKYGSYAGYAQQYLFYYGREVEIGKGE